MLLDTSLFLDDVFGDLSGHGVIAEIVGAIQSREIVHDSLVCHVAPEIGEE